MSASPAMNFAPAPPNDFREFIDTYFSRCRAVCPKLIAVAGKWTFADLIPGLSDFDTRFIASDDTTADDWAAMSLAIGKVHTDLARGRPDWARNLEHLPGINLTVAEITDEALYYPEFKQWTFYDGDREALVRIEAYLESRPWSPRDEAFHLRKFSLYYGPYRRGIDPAVNVGAWENKYPLHSRYMHYFAPPVQSAVAITLRRPVPGKLESLRLARDLFPNGQVIDMILNAVDAHYELPSDYVDPRLAQLEQQLQDYLRSCCASLAPHVTLVDIRSDESPESLSAKIGSMPSDPADTFREGVKFARLMKGRLLFYSETIPGFDSVWLIRNELGRIIPSFYEKPLTSYGQVRFGKSLGADDVLSRLRGELLSQQEYAAVRDFVRIASQPFDDASARQRSGEVADRFEPVQRLCERLGDDLTARSRTLHAAAASAPPHSSRIPTEIRP